MKSKGIFLSNKPDSNHLRRVWLEEKCRFTQIVVAGSFRPLLAGLKRPLTQACADDPIASFEIQSSILYMRSLIDGTQLCLVGQR
jgi:hypothetical protein